MLTFPFPWLTFAPSPASASGDASGAPSDPHGTTAAESAIEARILQEVASYGKQIGILADALLEVADDRPGPGVERLRGLVNRVEIVKAQYQRALEDKAEEAFDALLASDRTAAERLVAAFEQRVGTARSDRDDEGTPG